MAAAKSQGAIELAPLEGRALLRLARQAIAGCLRVDLAPMAAELAQALTAPHLQERRGVFVTLKSDGRLRGCIGSLQATVPLVEGVKSNARKAAVGDPRFPELRADELPRVRIEVSVLTPLQPLAYDNAAALVANLRPGRDGVLIEQGGRSATFLPQVWEQLPRPEIFLDHLCLKAGLPATAWRDGGLRVQTYQVQAFAEDCAPAPR